MLDFAETGRGGVEVLREAEAALGSNAQAGQGIANLRTVLDLLDAAGVPDGPDRDRPGPGPRARLLHGHRLRDDGQRLGEVRQHRLGRTVRQPRQPVHSRRLPGVGASIGLDRLLALMDEAGWLKAAATTAAGAGGQLPGRRPGRSRSGWPPGCAPPGIGAEVYPEPIQIGKQMGYGSTRGHKLAVIVGPDEAARAGLQPPQPGHPAGGQGARLVGPGRLGPERAGDHRAGRDRLMSCRPIGSRSRRPARARPERHDRAGARHARLAARATHAGLLELERLLLDQFRRAGYQPMRTPILEFTELHERKSGAGIVAKLFEVRGAGTAEICLRPELTASIVRAYAEAATARPSLAGEHVRPGLPVRDARARTATASSRRSASSCIGAGGPAADAEVIWLADWSLPSAGGPGRRRSGSATSG